MSAQFMNEHIHQSDEFNLIISVQLQQLINKGLINPKLMKIKAAALKQLEDFILQRIEKCQSLLKHKQQFQEISKSIIEMFDNRIECLKQRIDEISRGDA